MASLTKKNGMAASKNGTKNGTKVVDPAKPPATPQRKDLRKDFTRRESGPQITGGGFGTLNLIVRLIIWYALYTVLFRCPPVPTPDCPTICHPTHTIKIALRPHIQPYYKAYVAPYVQEYSPHVQRANTDYIFPAYNTVHASYRRYGEPHVAKGSDYAEAGYNRFLKPHVATAQSKLGDYVNIYVSPHAEKASKIWINDVKPSVDIVKQKVGIFWKNNVLPSYNVIQPYLAKAYEQGKYVILTIIAPVVKEGGEKAVGWGRGMWSEVVRPQVGRIGERLGGTNGNGVPVSVVSESLSSLSTPKQSKDAAASEASILSMISSASASKASDEAAGASDQPKKMTKAEAKEMIKDDLVYWSAKFKSSSDKTVADLRSQIDQISEKAYTDKQDAVEKELARLQKLVDEGLASLRAEANKLASQLEPGSTREEKNVAEDKLLAATRLLGTRIRDMAQSLRKDAENYLAKLYDDVSLAADQHLNVLDSVNDLGMQELGMKWAWMDYVGYKDWAKYHDLKKEFKESRVTIIKSAESNEKLLEVTQWVEDAWEGRATEIAKEAAEELGQVKEIGKKKIELADASDDFTDDHTPTVAQNGGADKPRNAIVGEEQKDDTIKEKMVDAADEAKVKLEEILSPSHTPAGESLVSTASSAVQSVASQASEKIYGTKPSAAEKVGTALSEAIESVSSVASATAQSVKAKVPGGVHAGFVASAESTVYEDGEDFVGGVQSRLEEASKAVSQAINDAVGRGTTPETPHRESLQFRASDLHASAVSVASSILYGSPTPVTEEWASIATDKYFAAVAAASSILYDTPTPTHEVLMEQARVAYTRATEHAWNTLQQAKKMAATKVATTEKPILESMYSVASEKYSSAISAADSSYSSILSAGAEAKKNYDDAVSSAKASRSSADAAASTEAHRANIMGSAQEKYEQAKADARKAYESWFYAASVQIYGTPTPVVESYLSEASSSAASAASVFGESISSVAGRAERVRSAASEKVYGTPAPSGVSASAASLVSEAAESIASATDNAQELAATRYAELQSLINELMHGKEPTFSESVMNRFSSAFYGSPTPLLSQASSFAASATAAVASMPPAIDSMVSDAVSRVKAAAAEASVAIYGKEPTQVEKYQQRLRQLGKDAVDNVSAAIYGTDKGSFERATETAASIASQASENAASVVSAASENIASAASQASLAASSVGVKFGIVEEEKAYKDQLIENASRRIWNAIAAAEDTLRSVGEKAKEHAQQAEEAFETMKKQIKDEL